jgi:3-deoxy-D-manno-octulosonic-acid transferase
MYLVYSLLLTLGFLILLPRFLVDALRHGKYVAGFGERLGRLDPFERQGRPVIWLHCVSVGETQAARPLVKALCERFPDHALVVSTITRTGHDLACELFQHEAKRVFYFPFDWRWTVRRSLKAVKPSAVLIMETEIWPGFLRACSEQQIPVAIVNGRLSRQSFRRYKWVKSFVSRVLNCLSIAAMQTEADAERIHGLGLDPARIFVTGNLKFDAGTIPANGSLAAEFKKRFGIENEASLILAASTHAPEESVILEAFERLRTRMAEKPRLLLAPRHPERFTEVAALIQRSGFTWTSRSAPAHSLDQNCDVILLDTIGELPSLYSLASAVFVGGSIVRKGGHNIVEPAAAGVAIVTGAHTHNFEAIVNEFLRAGALIQLPPVPPHEAAAELSSRFAELLQDRGRRDELGQKAKNLVEKNRGVVTRTLNLLETLLSRR